MMGNSPSRGIWSSKGIAQFWAVRVYGVPAQQMRPKYGPAIFTQLALSRHPTGCLTSVSMAMYIPTEGITESIMSRGIKLTPPPKLPIIIRVIEVITKLRRSSLAPPPPPPDHSVAFSFRLERFNKDFNLIERNIGMK